MQYQSKVYRYPENTLARLLFSRLFSPPTQGPTSWPLRLSSVLKSTTTVSSNFCNRSICQWNSIIKARIDSGLFDAALTLFFALWESGTRPDHFTFPLINNAISSLTNCFCLGEAIHCLGTRMGFSDDLYFGNTTITFYVQYGFVHSARQLFDEMCIRDVVSWTSMISGYIQIKETSKSSWLFSRMRANGCEPTPVTLAAMLRACTLLRDAVGGAQLHGLAVKHGLENHELVQNSILTLFSKTGSLEATMEFFKRSKRNAVSWNIMITGYFHQDNISRAVDLYQKMKAEMGPTHETLTIVISAFAKWRCLWQGEKLHSFVVRSGNMDTILHSSFVDFYAKCGQLEPSVLLFEEMKTKNVSAWTVMMWGFIQNGQFQGSIDVFRRMQNATEFEPIADALQGLVVSYAHLGALQLGKATHGYILRNKFVSGFNSKSMETSVLNMYADCGSIVLARRCFDCMEDRDIVAWSSMIDGYGIHGLGSDALALFDKMLEEGIEPNGVTFLSLLSACSHSGLLNEARGLFDSMIRVFGIEPEVGHYTCLVDVLGRSGNLDEALGVIDNMSVEPDGRIWGALLSSCRMYSDRGLAIYAARKLVDLEPDNVGYRVIMSNVQAGKDRWDEVENIRNVMREEELKKQPGWSCITGEKALFMFVAGGGSHAFAREIREVLGCFGKQMEELKGL